MKRHEKVVRYSTIAVIGFVAVVFILASLGTAAHAAGLVDDTINTANEYSKYGLDNYQLDFYVDNSWGWLPWNWSDGLGKSSHVWLIRHHEFHLDNLFVFIQRHWLLNPRSLPVRFYQ